MMLLASLAGFAIVTQDQAALRAAPRDSAQQQVALWQGDLLEVRGEKQGFLQVYDHRRERAGFVRAGQVRGSDLKPADAPGLLAVLRFVRDTPGMEALGIGYAAAYLKAAPAEAIDAEPFDALGGMAERLARRASGKLGRAGDATLAAHLEVAAGYGVQFASIERDSRVQLCYDGDAYRRVLALPASEAQRANAALALTRPDCIAPETPPTQRYALDQWRAELLDRIDTAKLAEYQKNRIRLRRAGVWAGLAYQRSRRAEPVQAAAARALQELAAVNKQELAEEDNAAYADAAVRVGASRWAAESPVALPGKLTVATVAGQPGETCVLLIDPKIGNQAPLLKRCSWGTVWAASASANVQGTALALAVQPLDSWRELWIFRRGEAGWSVDVLPPAANSPDVGYIEAAGWTPDGKQLLAAREARIDGRYKRSFELIGLDNLDVQRWADKPESLSAFYRWQSAGWKRGTVALR
ncbi:hypothetical protein [Chitinimonas koreensis]|uniref:hypothetical protein n=1 Tax=Chitinimonas koreensis TaxID=356302 RepID=UPI0004106BD9|nr:hypothetical protein [Chitinimonas koreensis]QNM96790.1 hypothetical protein H9L41_00025 [Chitinimonas koreensis]